MTQNFDITNIQTDRSIPLFIQENYPMFQVWLAAYFEFLSLQGNPTDLVQNLLNYGDIDSTLDEFLSHFNYTYAPLIPANIAADRRLVIKHIKQFYQTKGTEAGFRFLFRILFNEDIEFFYPKTQILKCSDGKWQQVISVKIAQSDLTNIQNIFSGTISGANSFAKAEVYGVLSYTDRGIPVYELILNNLRGAFIDGEQILINGLPNSPQIFVLEVISGIDIIDGGFKYNVGDQVNIVDTSIDQIVGTGNVIATARGPIVGFQVDDGGINYNGELREVVDFAHLPIGWTLNGVYLPDAVIGGSSYNENFSIETIGHSITLQDVPGIGDPINVTDEPSPVGQGASGIVHLVTQDGEILQTRVITSGANYEFPIANVVSTTGSGAILEVLGGGGRITAIQLNNFPVVERTEMNPNDTLVPDFSPSLTGSGASGTVELDGGTISYTGNWINDDGKLSSTMKLQDNKYYQDFSYVILSRLNSTTWQNIVNKISHPAGFLNFGQLKFKSVLSNPAPIISETSMTFADQTFIITPDGFQVELPDGGDLLTQ